MQYRGKAELYDNSILERLCKISARHNWNLEHKSREFNLDQNTTVIFTRAKEQYTITITQPLSNNFPGTLRELIENNNLKLTHAQIQSAQNAPTITTNHQYQESSFVQTHHKNKNANT